MNERIRRLREVASKTTPSVSSERALLLTQFMQQDAVQQLPIPIQRAKAFHHLMSHQTLTIEVDELIVGERGPQAKATPTYPELCCHSLEDLTVLNTRVKTPFTVSAVTKQQYADTVIPYWAERSMREQVFDAMSPSWQDAFDAGVFTEFMEQRAPGHAVLDDKIYRLGIADLRKRIAESRQRFASAESDTRQGHLDELDAMDICCDAIILFANRHAALARERANDRRTSDQRKVELNRIADVCMHVPEYAPRTFHEALQMYWFVHLGVICELNEWDSLNPGRLDQHLFPFYERESAAGTLYAQSAKELLACFWLKFSNQPAPPKVGVTVEQSATYNDFTLINVGGVDANGENAVNELSYLMLDVIEEMKLPYTGSCIQLSKTNPDRFLLRTLEVIRQGFGQPSIFNTDAILQQFLRAGKSIADARAGGPSGCVTISAFGKESCVLTGYMNWAKLLELALHNGLDPATGKQIGPQTGDVDTFDTFDDVIDAYSRQLTYFVDLKMNGNQVIEQLFAQHMPAPFLSLFVDDCIARAEDYNGAGPRYPTTYIQGVGMGTTTDSLAAIQSLVYEQQILSMTDLLNAVDSNFTGAEELRSTLVHHTPKFGNDDDSADHIARTLFELYFNAIDGRPNTKGGSYRINLLPTTAHIFFGEKVGATADGRHAGMPVSDGISPSQGADIKGPTAVLKSVGKIDHVRTGGTLLNQRFLPDVLKDESGLRKLASLVRTYFRFDGHHIQFNVVDSDTLRKAQANPEQYRDLIVRVAGYSDYFCVLDPALQNEIIQRTAHSDL